MKLAAVALVAVGLKGSQQMLVTKTTSVADDMTSSVVSGLARSLAEIQLRASTVAQVSRTRSAALDFTSVTSRACASIALCCRSIFDSVLLLRPLSRRSPSNVANDLRGALAATLRE